uniref:Pol polyprotein n=1 Tax=Cajanus cajan TaxID=3821 RepID=A0A151SVS9_CAJCA|nr:Pol polyprotein [Cajanus cajan]
MVHEVECEAFLHSFLDGYLLKTLIVLIQKIDNSSNLKDFYPISLCNLAYKVISKVIVARLHPYLHDTIGPFQESFILGKGTLDNSILAQETLYFIPKDKDILGHFPVAKGQCKFLIVVVDLFTKWIEVEPLASISAHQVQKFLWKNIITRFGVPSTLVTDNSLQFTDRKLNEFLVGLGIQHKVTSVEHPQKNGQVESVNKVILTELKKRLGEAKGAWAEQLPEVLWAYRCTPQSTTRETPFRLVYGSDAMLPVEIGEPSFRRAHFDESNNEVELRASLDMVEEIRDQALVVAEACKQRYKRKFDTKVRPREFREGDLVWRVTGEARKDPRHGKLAPN